VINVAQMTQMVIGMHSMLEVEEERFLPLFVQYKPDMAEVAVLGTDTIYIYKDRYR